MDRFMLYLAKEGTTAIADHDVSVVSARRPRACPSHPRPTTTSGSWCSHGPTPYVCWLGSKGSGGGVLKLLWGEPAVLASAVPAPVWGGPAMTKGARRWGSCPCERGRPLTDRLPWGCDSVRPPHPPGEGGHAYCPAARRGCGRWVERNWRRIMFGAWKVIGGRCVIAGALARAVICPRRVSRSRRPGCRRRAVRTDTACGVDQPGGLGAELAAQQAHQGDHQVQIERRVAPHPLEEPGLGEHLPGVAGQHR
jgi:hypothetical protein